MSPFGNGVQVFDHVQVNRRYLRFEHVKRYDVCGLLQSRTSTGYRTISHLEKRVEADGEKL